MQRERAIVKVRQEHGSYLAIVRHELTFGDLIIRPEDFSQVRERQLTAANGSGFDRSAHGAFGRYGSRSWHGGGLDILGQAEQHGTAESAVNRPLLKLHFAR